MPVIDRLGEDPEGLVEGAREGRYVFRQCR